MRSITQRTPRLLGISALVISAGIVSAGGSSRDGHHASADAVGNHDSRGASSNFREEDVPEFEPVSERDRHVGRIEIPRVGVSAPILEGVDYATIRRAVGHFPETPLPDTAGNMALAAHRTTDFRGLKEIRIGDVVTITTQAGSFSYEVDETFVVHPEDTYVLEPTEEKTLTLVTCYPFDFRGSAPYRFIVRARAQTG